MAKQGNFYYWRCNFQTSLHEAIHHFTKPSITSRSHPSLHEAIHHMACADKIKGEIPKSE